MIPRTLHAVAFVLGLEAVLLAVGQTADVLVESYMTLFFAYGVGIFLFGPAVWALNAWQVLVSLVALAVLWGAARGRWQRTSNRELAWQAVAGMLLAGVLVVLPIPVVGIALNPEWLSIPWILLAGWEQWVAVALLLPIAALARSQEPASSPARVDLATAAGAAVAATILGAVVPVGLVIWAATSPDPEVQFTPWFVVALFRGSAGIPGFLALFGVAVARTETGRLRAAIGLTAAMAVSAVGYFFVLAWPTALAAAVAVPLGLLASRNAALEAREAD